MKSVLTIHWKDWCCSWISNTMASWSEVLTHLKRSWCWERLKAGGEGDDRAWDGWMASPTQWPWVWVSSRSWWWIGKPGMLQSMGSQRVEHNWVTELNWIIFIYITCQLKGLLKRQARVAEPHLRASVVSLERRAVAEQERSYLVPPPSPGSSLNPMRESQSRSALKLQLKENKSKIICC